MKSMATYEDMRSSILYTCEEKYDGSMVAYVIGLERQLSQLKLERDALAADFELYRERNIQQKCGVYACDLCVHGVNPYTRDEDIDCPEGCDGMNHWKWRGIQDQKGSEQDDQR